MMSLRQDEHFYTYSDQYIRHLIRQTCFGGRVGANIPEFISSLRTEIKTILQNYSNTKSEDACNSIQENKIRILCRFFA